MIQIQEMINKLNLYKGLVLGKGNRAISIEKANSENIYVRLSSSEQRRIIPTQLIVDLLVHLKKNTISIEDISRQYRVQHGLPHLFEFLELDYENFLLGCESTISKLCEYELNYLENLPKKSQVTSTQLPKPFILLAGISGTGKTRFVKQQAQYFKQDNANYCLVPVRPDWHEPSDLLGYISRLGNNGAEYIVTDFLVFLVAAWKASIASIDQGEISYNKDCAPYWLCLDEMNLAPVEQYFADYLAVIETRCWDDGQYTCEALLKASVFKQVEDRSKLRESLNLQGDENSALWGYFLAQGISIPPNLIVAGTVNMDETTHGFSRKVIDRAFTIDFGEFFPNDYQHYFSPTTQPKTLSFSLYSHVDAALISADDAKASIQFLEAINQVLKASPFELAYRALNELLLAVLCFKPKTAIELQAVWDDFLMTKVLPRIEGDSEKLQEDGENNILIQLEHVLAKQLGGIWADEQTRPDLLRESLKGEELAVSCRSKKKLSWMQARLSNNGFTSFWP